MGPSAEIQGGFNKNQSPQFQICPQSCSSQTCLSPTTNTAALHS